MSEHRQTAVRWDPLPNIPESPIADLRFESDEYRRLVALLRYSWIKGNELDLVLIFPEVLALRTFWDGDSDGSVRHDHPRCSGPLHEGELWPLTMIENSSWIATGHFAISFFIAGNGKDAQWKHYRVLTYERSLDILARGKISGRWIAKTERADLRQAYLHQVSHT